MRAHTCAPLHAVLLPLHKHEVLSQDLEASRDTREQSQCCDARQVPLRPGPATAPRKPTHKPRKLKNRHGHAHTQGCALTCPAMPAQNLSMPGSALVQCRKSRDMRYSRRVRPAPRAARRQEVFRVLRERQGADGDAAARSPPNTCMPAGTRQGRCSAAAVHPEASRQAAAQRAAAARQMEENPAAAWLCPPSLLGRHTCSWCRWFLQLAARAPRSILPGELRPGGRRGGHRKRKQ